MMTNDFNGAISGAAIVSPWWLPMIEHTSSAATLLLPILGVGWLLLQGVLAVWSRMESHKALQRASDQKFVDAVTKIIEPAAMPGDKK